MKKVLTLLILSVIFVQCNSNDKTVIAKGKVGEITKTTTIEELEDMFKNDSVVKLPEGEEFVNEYVIYSEEGERLLSVFPSLPQDSIKAFERVQVYSPGFKTEKGVSTASTFRDINSNYSIKKIDPTISSAVVYIDELNGMFILNKKDLGLDEFDMNKISKDQVPDLASIKYITIWFD
ncbi:MAG: hypothetical protein ABFR05_06810 [Bacteroidota bacterium]